MIERFPVWVILLAAYLILVGLVGLLALPIPAWLIAVLALGSGIAVVARR